MSSIRDPNANYRTAQTGIVAEGDDIPAVTLPDYGFILNGVQLGAGTGYELVNIDGLLSHDIRRTPLENMNNHGSMRTYDYVQERRVTFTILVRGTASTVPAKIDTLVGAFSPASLVGEYSGAMPAIEDVLEFKLPNQAQRRLYGRPGRVDVTFVRLRQGWAQVVAEFVCPDPRIYASTETTDSGTSITVTNNGNAPAPWFLSVGSGATDFSIGWTPYQGAGLLEFVGTTLSDTVTLDSLNKRAYYRDSTDHPKESVYGLMTGRYFFWLMPGSNTITASDSVDFAFRDAWW